jgi:hypothetical protein
MVRSFAQTCCAIALLTAYAANSAGGAVSRGVLVDVVLLGLVPSPCKLSSLRLVSSASFAELGPHLLRSRSFMTRYLIFTSVVGGIMFWIVHSRSITIESWRNA